MKAIRPYFPFPSGSYSFDLTIDSLTETLTVDLNNSGSWPIFHNNYPSVIQQLFTACVTHTNFTFGTITPQNNGSLRFAFGTSSFSFSWQGATNIPANYLGFEDNTVYTSSNDGGVQAIFSPSNAGIWLPNKPVSQDTFDRTTPVGGTKTAISGRSRTTHFGSQLTTRDVRWELLTREVVLEQFGEAKANTFEFYWLNSIAKGYEFDVYDEVTDTYSSATYKIRSNEEPITRSSQFSVRWDVSLDLVKTKGSGAP